MSFIYTYRTLARIVLEAETPVKVGSGEKDITTDARIALDINGLPYIPGSALAGVIRHILAGEMAETVFGGEKKGSEIIFSDANLVFEGGHVVDGILPERTPFLNLYDTLPIRQHVRIGHRGAAEDKGKFDETVVFAGSRFCFEMELLSLQDGKEILTQVLSTLYQSYFRIGGGSRRGFGKIRIVQADIASLDLSKEADRTLYLNKSACLDKAWQGWTPFRPETQESEGHWTTRTIHLRPEDFFLFASGNGDDDADITPTKECKVVWRGDEPAFQEHFFVVPASSVKGALAHRIAYHFNRLSGIFADQQAPEEAAGANNAAIAALFGNTTRRGHVILSDLFLTGQTKLLNHNSIDEYTGGTLDGHLFTEKVSFGRGLDLVLEISVDEQAFQTDIVRKAFNCAISDLCAGRLPLGNGANKGNGVFTGTIDKPF